MTLPQLPLAQEVDKTPYSPHEFHNRVRKALLIAAGLRLWQFSGVLTARGINSLTREQMATTARSIGERAPGVTAAGSPTEDLISLLLHAIRSEQPTGRTHNLQKTQWVPQFNDELHQAIAIAFEAFWNKFDGRPTQALIEGLSDRELTQLARRVQPTGPPMRVTQRTASLTRRILGVIWSAQPGGQFTDQTLASPHASAPALVHAPALTDEATLTSALTAAVAAARTSDSPTIVVLHFPQ
ncbi:hypothetical protein [Streptomyces sp. NPDC055912]|uniref:hypothetical protein n=1 Tax=Streptomyces sp. NPDC055912 TaxID=3345660 RepID=UPI0035D64150